jgi:heme exporter protein CcmD
MDDFLSMGGYGAFVWPAYLISAVTIALLTAFIVARARRARRRLGRLEKRDD